MRIGERLMNIFKYVTMLWLIFISFDSYAADSYRYLHVTIDTPWMIFIFLLVIIMIPFILMAVLYWYFAYKKSDERSAVESSSQDNSTVE